MEQERPDEPIRDPFFRELRRRHPEIDIVLLPPEPPPATADADAEQAAAEELIRVGTQARQLWSAIAPDATDGPEVRYRFGGRRGQRPPGLDAHDPARRRLRGAGPAAS